jgi:hypothetical protein
VSLKALGVRIEPVVEADAFVAASIWFDDSSLSLGARCCLALGSLTPTSWSVAKAEQVSGRDLHDDAGDFTDANAMPAPLLSGDVHMIGFAALRLMRHGPTQTPGAVIALLIIFECSIIKSIEC